MPRTAVTVSLSLKAEDVPRFEELVERFGKGSRAEFLRRAMDRMERVELMEDIGELQTYGRQRRGKTGRAGESVNSAVQRIGRQMADEEA